MLKGSNSGHWVVLGGEIRRNAPIMKPNDACAMGGHGILVGDDQHGLPFLMQAAEDLENVRTGARVEVAGGFISKQDRRLVEERSRDCHPLLLATRQLIRHLLGAPGHVDALLGKATILCTGGAGRTYLFSTAPRGATGDGIAMAWRAGCRVSNMEMNQFHPTCLYNLEVKNFLITEAVRGEGGHLKLPPGVPGGGERFMPRFDDRAELAPRDIVARAIDHEIKRLGLDYVHLDISHKPPEFVKHHFPTIYARLLDLDIDITREPIPVVPAQHYTCGGVIIDLDGRTDLPGLYAAGEVTESGLHGANRLASNSLLECFVFGEAAAKDILECWDKLDDPPEILSWDESRVTDSDEEVVIKQNWTEIRRFMWNYVGIVRTTRRLERARRRIRMIREEIQQYYWDFVVTSDLVELRNIATVAELIIDCALLRKESRGLHYTLDHPTPDDEVWRRDTLIRRGEGPRRGPLIRP